MTTKPRKRAKRGDGHKLRDEIIAHTSALITKAGHSARVSIADVSAAVRITPPSIYRHFATKEELITATAVHMFDQLADKMAETSTTATSPLDALYRIGLASIQFSLDHPVLYMALIAPNTDAGLDPRGLKAFIHLKQAVQDCIDAGTFSDQPAEDIALSFWAVSYGITTLSANLQATSADTAEALTSRTFVALAAGFSRQA